MPVDVVVLAIPVFFGLIGLEAMIVRLQGRPGQGLEGAVSNLGCGMLQQCSQVFVRTAFFGAYLWVYAVLNVQASVATSTLAIGAALLTATLALLGSLLDRCALSPATESAWTGRAR